MRLVVYVFARARAPVYNGYRETKQRDTFSRGVGFIAMMRALVFYAVYMQIVT